MTWQAKRVVTFIGTVAAGIAVLMYFDHDLEDLSVMVFVIGVAAVLSLVESVFHTGHPRSDHDAKR
jgi:hypothetical protein